MFNLSSNSNWCLYDLNLNELIFLNSAHMSNHNILWYRLWVEKLTNDNMLIISWRAMSSCIDLFCNFSTLQVTRTFELVIPIYVLFDRNDLKGTKMIDPKQVHRKIFTLLCHCFKFIVKQHIFYWRNTKKTMSYRSCIWY